MANRRIRRIVWVPAAALAVAGCATTSPDRAVTATPPPIQQTQSRWYPSGQFHPSRPADGLVLAAAAKPEKKDAVDKAKPKTDEIPG